MFSMFTFDLFSSQSVQMTGIIFSLFTHFESMKCTKMENKSAKIRILPFSHFLLNSFKKIKKIDKNKFALKFASCFLSNSKQIKTNNFRIREKMCEIKIIEIIQ